MLNFSPKTRFGIAYLNIIKQLYTNFVQALFYYRYRKRLTPVYSTNSFKPFCCTHIYEKEKIYFSATDRHAVGRSAAFIIFLIGWTANQESMFSEKLKICATAVPGWLEIYINTNSYFKLSSNIYKNLIRIKKCFKRMHGNQAKCQATVEFEISFENEYLYRVAHRLCFGAQESTYSPNGAGFHHF